MRTHTMGIGDAILHYVADRVGGTVGRDFFYEDLPIDPETGMPVQYGVYLSTVAAPRTQAQDHHEFLLFTIFINPGASDTQGRLIDNKAACDAMADAIEDVIFDALGDPDSWCLRSSGCMGVGFHDVRLLPSSGVGAINSGLKTVQAEVYWKRS